MTPLQKLPKIGEDLGNLIVAKGFKKLPKVQKITQSGHTDWHCYVNLKVVYDINSCTRLMKKGRKQYLERVQTFENNKNTKDLTNVFYYYWHRSQHVKTCIQYHSSKIN